MTAQEARVQRGACKGGEGAAWRGGLALKEKGELGEAGEGQLAERSIRAL